jgi:hypothetical protein
MIKQLFFKNAMINPFIDLGLVKYTIGIIGDNPSKPPSGHHPSLGDGTQCEHWSHTAKHAHRNESVLPKRQVRVDFVSDDEDAKLPCRLGNLHTEQKKRTFQYSY